MKDLIVRWVETGKAPDQITACFIDEKMQTAGSSLICPYSQVAKYDSEGDTQDVSSFSWVNANRKSKCGTEDLKTPFYNQIFLLN